MKIVFTGGGTGGHIIPNLVVIEEVRKLQPKAQIYYIGSANSIEEKLAKEKGITFRAILVGKLRRYFSWKNFVDIFKIPIGVIQAILLLRKLKPSVVFAKGGFVSFPTSFASWVLRIPLIIHESDANFGLATRMVKPFAKKICVAFPCEDLGEKIMFTGNPTRKKGDANRGKKFLGFENEKPTLLIVGGSSGALFLNQLAENTIEKLLEATNVVWIFGKNYPPPIHRPNLKAFDFLSEEYLDVLAACDLVVSRSGANALFEIAMSGKPNILIPLPTLGSRGDQLLNAQIFEKHQASIVVNQEELSNEAFVDLVKWALESETRMRKLSENVGKLAPRDAGEQIAKIILENALS
jgi:UDP-N-acetylglucosamine--N-acetylmuramyl-(pentapeptide) pyrophosphoryl-undecaprenol N-acetylglucosamine transferase